MEYRGDIITFLKKIIAQMAKEDVECSQEERENIGSICKNL